MAVVAKLRYTTPDLGKYVIRGTVPVPEGYVWTKNCPFTVVDEDGEKLTTQWEPIKYHHNGDVSIVEILAHTKWKKSGEQFVELIDEPSGFSRPALNPWLLKAVSMPWAAFIRMRDVEGNWHFASLTSKFQDSTVHRWGAVAGTVQCWERLSDSFGGVQCFWHLEKHSEHAELDFVLHNNFVDEPNEDLWFDRLQLVIPLGTSVHSALPIYLGERTKHESLPMSVIDLVEPLPDGQMHLMPQGYQHVWRLGFAVDGFEDLLVEELTQKGFAVCVPGEGLWSWQSLPHYGAGFKLPSLEGMPNPGGFINSHHANLWESFKLGTPYWSTGGSGVKHGLWHPEGSQYKGMTGGQGIYHNHGADTAWTGDHKSIQYHMGHQAMMMDRHHGTPIEDNGKAPKQVPPSTYPDKWTWFWGVNGGTYKGDPFGWAAVETPHTDAVRAQDKAPYYEDWLRKWQSHDTQHGSRVFWQAIVLWELYGDPISKLWTTNYAETLHWEYRGNEYLKGLEEEVEEFPASGLNATRAHGWVCRAMACALAWNPMQEGLHHKSWIERFMTASMQAQMYPGNGGAVSQSHGKPVSWMNGKYRGSAMMSTFHINNGLHAGLKAGAGDPNLMSQYFKEGLQGLLETAWGPEDHAPQFEIGCGSLDRQIVWPDWDSIPLEAKNKGVFDSHNFPATLASALSTNPGDEGVLDLVREAMRRNLGSDDLNEAVTSHLLKGTNALSQRSSFLAALQEVTAQQEVTPISL